MANKSLNKIEKLNNIELIDLFKKNGYGEFEEVLRDNEVDGKRVFALKEFEVMRWKLPPIQRRRLWSYVVELLQNPQKFLGEVKPQNNFAINRKLSTSNQNIREKLELVIGGIKTGEKSFQKPEVKVSPSTVPLEDYLPMDKQIRDDDDSPYDGAGYLLPTGQSLEVEENNYEPPPKPKNVPGLVPSRYRDFMTPIAQRPPKALPRDEEEIGDYILEPEGPTRRNTLERREMPNLYPKAQINHRNIPLKSTRTPSPNKTLDVPNSEDEDVEETYEPAPDVTRPIYSNENRDYGAQDNESLSKKLKEFLLTLRRKSPYEEHERKWNSLNIKSSRDKSPTDSVKSVEKDVSLKSRPLPPLPWEMEDIAPLEIYQNIRENSPNEDPEAVYSNEDLENNLATQFTNRNKIQANSTLPLKRPSGYEPYRMTNCADKKKLPAPPNTLPTIPLNPQLLPSNQDEEELEEYNNAIFNINDEPYYRNTDRKGARLLLHDLEDGAFLFRPSKRFFLTLSVKYRGKYCNLGIEKSESNKIRLNTDEDNMSPEFPTLSDLVAYFTREYLTFQHDGSIVEVRLKRVLPHDRY